MIKNQAKDKKHPLYDFFKKILRLFKKKPLIVYLGEEVKTSSIILSNHVGASGPLAWELYPIFSFRFWGTYEMNGSLITVYKYLSKIYFHQKKHWPLWLSRIFCVIAAPVMKGFYKGLEVISTYKDVRLKSTITKSIEILDKGHNIIIFPEDSSSGYFDKMKKFFTGYLFLAKQYYKKGNDIPIFVSYYCKEKRKIVIDQPIKYSELSIKYEGASPEEIAKKMLERCNQLGEDIKANKY